MGGNTGGGGRALFETHYLCVGEILGYIGRRHRLTSEDREDFASFAMLKLVENDYARIRKFRGESQFNTYVTVVLQRLFLDYRTQKWGKWRPSRVAQKLGTVAMRLETLLYRDGFEFHEARQILLTSTACDRTEEELWELAGKLPRRERFFCVDDEVLARLGTARYVDDFDRHEAAGLLGELQSQLKDATSDLSSEDRLLLKMRFDEGLSVPEIATMVNLKPKAIYARITRLLKRIRCRLEEAGVRWETLESLIGRAELAMDLEVIFPDLSNRARLSV